ncbi:MAG: hypothetical protein KDA91_23330 [Planctomycetaceae bacterium]|nr:hypothetical protein [Planctomycetaceae bacterium]
MLKLLANRGRNAMDVCDTLFTNGELERDHMQRWDRWLGGRDRLDDALRQFHKMTKIIAIGEFS